MPKIELHLRERLELSGLAEQIRTYIRTNCLATTFSLRQMSEDLSYSQNYLSRIWKASTGVPIVRYVNELRVQRSIALMRTSNLRLTDLCRQAGFEDVRYFSRVFKQITGVTPHEMQSEENNAVYADEKRREIQYRYYANSNQKK